MSVLPFESLACPLDGMSLCREGKSWRCENGHSFDIARQGYVHLLPVQKKRSKDPGDSKAMVAARQRFLETGLYQPIADAVANATLKDVPAESTLRCLDAGCGEGYYLRQLGLAADGVDLSLLGLDISKWAVLSGARQDRRASWVVGSNANLPVLPGSLDRVLCLFGFPVYAEFARVLRPGGRLIQVDSGQDHLRELREIIYPEVRAESKKIAEAPEGFQRIASEDIRFPMHLAGAEPIADLLAMTPHLYRASQEGRERAAALDSLSLTVDVCLHTFEREP
ncbi:putative RNA methyltransferase [Marinobacter litoralis]|uniref:putative RNA methyltransferase n=1 Tax=Marinobacter litoralis TaxID=187981 RepID=UPI0018EA3568|nr:methyltransferase domain-containing protein [Marinobacter litoralis]MBJ6138968.1 methyltransferase domain-containing protein [Marinobacter litoralis]